jgi:cytochrome c oxidase cbb3-type subunit III
MMKGIPGMKVSLLAGAALLLFTAGCNRLPGAPKAGVEEFPRPDSITSFKSLYGQNCAGCHGDNGRNGAAFALNNPVYQAWADDATLRRIIENGEPGTQMPAFGTKAGGMLNDAQLDALVHGMRAEWSKSDAVSGQTLPPYAATKTGDAAAGKAVYESACARCHSDAGNKITDPTYLALVDDQTLRTIIVAGRPDLGHPDWRSTAAGHALSDDDITNLTAWLASQRIKTPGQPYAEPQ